MFVLSILELSMNAIELQTVSQKVNEKRLHLNVCLLSLMIFKIMLITRMLALMKVYFSLLYVE